MKLEELRQQIDDIDVSILDLLSQRMKCSEKIAVCKQENALPIENKEREVALLERLKRYSECYDLDSYAVEEIFVTIIRISKEVQTHRLEEMERE